MLKVFFTVDTEIWCGGWDDLDRKFPDAFQRYVYGPTDQGNYALPMTMEILSDHGLKGVFFVEPTSLFEFFCCYIWKVVVAFVCPLFGGWF